MTAQPRPTANTEYGTAAPARPSRTKERRCYSVQEVSEMLGFSEHCTYEMLRKGEIPSSRIGNRRKYLIVKTTFDAWLESGCQANPGINVTNVSNVDRAGVDQIVEHIGRRLRERGNAI